MLIPEVIEMKEKQRIIRMEFCFLFGRNMTGHHKLVIMEKKQLQIVQHTLVI